jgi:hypothetical protein
MSTLDAAGTNYPVRYAVDYPDEALNRLTSAFRLIWILPILIVVWGVNNILFFPPLLMILFRRKYPRWWFDFNVELIRFTARVGAYAALLTDRYPSTDEEQSVHIEIEYPDAERDLNRWLPLVKWLLAIPHIVVLFVLAVIALLAVIAAWFAILFTGRYPRGLFDFVVGVNRWALRVEGYALLLVTDRYPPFSMS